MANDGEAAATEAKTEAAARASAPVEHAVDLMAVRDDVVEAGSRRRLWIGAGLALAVHLTPFLWFGAPDRLGDDVLTEAIAVDLVKEADLKGQDQTPPSPPATPTAPPPVEQVRPVPPGPPQRPQPAIAPSPSPAPPGAATPEPAQGAKAPQVFDGERDDVAKAAKRDAAKEATESKSEVKPDIAKKAETEAPPAPRRPPPQKPQTARAPPPQARAAPSRQASQPAQARSGQVTEFAKQVVAALAKAKPAAPGVTGKVTVTVVVAFGGGVRTARVTGSSDRKDLDTLALEAAKKAKLPPPPADVTTDDLFYDVEYVFQ